MVAPVSSTVTVWVLCHCSLVPFLCSDFCSPVLKEEACAKDLRSRGGDSRLHEAGAVGAVDRDTGVAETGARDGAVAVVGRAGTLLDKAGQGDSGQGQDGEEL